MMERTFREAFFADRVQAGRQLARALAHLKKMQPVVLALPRGGVVVGYEVADALHAPLDIVAVRKIGAPFHPELGIGALVGADEPELFLDSERTRMFAMNAEDLRTQVEAEFREMLRRERLYRGGEGRIDVHGRTVIVVDDGIATGSSMHAVLRGLQHAYPRRVVLAVPVAPPQTIEMLRNRCDEVVCLLLPSSFRAVGEFYRDFKQTTDEEVITLLRKNRALQAREEIKSASPLSSRVR
jgi:putative phosphoribosyl transferase